MLLPFFSTSGANISLLKKSDVRFCISALRCFFVKNMDNVHDNRFFYLHV